MVQMQQDQMDEYVDNFIKTSDEPGLFEMEDDVITFDEKNQLVTNKALKQPPQFIKPDNSNMASSYFDNDQTKYTNNSNSNRNMPPVEDPSTFYSQTAYHNVPA